MLDDINELRTFQAVLTHGSLTSAAHSLSVSLAVVSKRLATLEKRTGVRLVNRTTRSLSATKEGDLHAELHPDAVPTTDQAATGADIVVMAGNAAKAEAAMDVACGLVAAAPGHAHHVGR